MREGVPLRDVEPGLPAARDHAGVAVDAARRQPRFSTELQELAAPAADVQHVRRAVEVGEVALQPRANRLLRSPELVLEPDILVRIERGCERGLGVGGWRLEVGDWRLEVGGWDLGVD